MFGNFTLRRARALVLAAGVGVVLLQPAVSNAAPPQNFATPEAAVTAIGAALAAGNAPALVRIAGSDFKSLVVTGEPDVDKANWQAAAERLAAFNTLKTDAPDRRTVMIGAEAWPFPAPLVKSAQGWHFDFAEGEQELINRRIGSNELATIDVMRAFVTAQIDYASADHDGDGVRQYAEALASSPGKRDGLYWPADAAKNEAPSPWGPLVAASEIDIAARKAGEPYHGYRYRILTAQGPNAKGGAYNYVINGHMVAGYGLIAWPAEPGESGVMTFIVNQDGVVYQRDLGKDGGSIAAKMMSFDPAESWTPVTE
jgi:hypothetical protein